MLEFLYGPDMSYLNITHVDSDQDGLNDLVAFRFPLASFTSRGNAIVAATSDLMVPESKTEASKAAELLTDIVGDYALSDGMVSHLRREGVELEAGGVVPFTSPTVALKSLSKIEADRFFSVQEIVNYVERNDLKIMAWKIPQSSYTLVKDLLHATGRDFSWRQFLQTLIAVEGFRVPEIVLFVRKD